jgi:quercetin dioxygenase-like cupin family protein
MDVPPGFECRAVSVEPGGDRIYHDPEWRDALVLVARGEIELEWRDGRRCRLASGETFWLAGLPLRRIHNDGPETARLVAISRSANT